MMCLVAKNLLDIIKQLVTYEPWHPIRNADISIDIDSFIALITQHLLERAFPEGIATGRFNTAFIKVIYD